MPISQEWKELWSPFLYWLGALVKCWSHTKSKVSVLNHIWTRDKNVLPSDLYKYQMFVPNFKRLLPSPLKKMCWVPDVENMTAYPCYYWPLNFSPQCFLNRMWQGFKWILLMSSIFRRFIMKNGCKTWLRNSEVLKLEKRASVHQIRMNTA